ncbi:hypothetical protein OG455_23905 [Kitasatospora sp. NBC_01287]|uniref:hypothetical protein n=1 Tax=Kitasatospora sp. NBC_01287 TaxID=2903573 RepID=UPI00224E2993|nr:hypothetical protein [Kitasatospora sp. NBC_01287]MCX4748523.1 hypothetical protein [Kitasatospora sp. NBC_01287]
MTEAAMWEAKAVAGRGAELLGWVREHAVPALANAAERVELLSAPGDRVLLITWWPAGAVPVAPPEPPSELLARPVHRWAFHREYVVEAR